MTANGYPLTRVQCRDCLWFSDSGDRAWTLHSGRVHASMLTEGHRVVIAIDAGLICDTPMDVFDRR